VLAPSLEELRQRHLVISAIKQAVSTNTTIKLPGVGELRSPNQYAGLVSSFKYEFEGEDDLLHLAVTRCDGAALSPEEGQTVVSWLLPGMPPGLIWIRPGEFSQHFYCGHDDLVAHVDVS
jgi:hypothetical protein